MPRATPEVLEGGYVVLIKNRLKANEETDAAKWNVWKAIWECSSFEQLAQRVPHPVITDKARKRITWRTEVRWALKQGWIRKVDNNAQQ